VEASAPPIREEEVEREETALAIIEGQFTQIAQVARDPELILADGRKAARALNKILDEKPLKDRVMMGGERYLEFEDWSLMVTFFGKAISTPIKECRFVDLGVIEVEPGKPVAVHGYEATAYLIDIRTGRRVAEASMTCLTDEPKWRTKPKYEWVDDNPEVIAGRKVERRGVFEQRDGSKAKRARVQISEDPVPLFQLRSMAQTRAGSKVARLNYSWVAVLGGYAPTPAEEVEDQGPPASGDPVKSEDLKAISEKWKALVEEKDPAKKEGAQKKRDEIKAALRRRGYRGTAAKDLWADFASRGADDVEAIKIATGVIEGPTFAEETNGNGAKDTEPLFPEEEKK
jgi:hypothetical protein